MGRLATFHRDHLGATAIEYSLVAALMAITAIGALNSLSSNMSAMYDKIASNVAKST